MDAILDYIREKYRPTGLIVYGSFADGSNGPNSDFDALAIAEGFGEVHDCGLVDGTRLDLFVYPKSAFDRFDCADFVQIHDGKILLDTDGLAARIQSAVVEYLDGLPKKTPAENLASVQWCEKMLLRADRGDAEGLFRGHWLLVDSLEIYCDVTGRPYRGPKKALRAMREADPESYRLYVRALDGFDRGSAAEWIGRLRELL